ncbi:MAG: ATP-binding protein [Chloroflexota bacterium]
MPKKTLTPRQLLAENKELRARLDEANETLRAIHSGEVDALVISGVGGDQIFTLKGADHSYRILIEDMNEGALTLTADGVILYANRRCAELLKTPLEKVIGSAIYAWIMPEHREILKTLLLHDDLQTRRAEATLLVGDGTSVQIILSINVVQIDEVSRYFCMVATDLTEQKRLSAIVTSEKLSQELLAASNQSRRALLSVIEDQKRAEEAERDQRTLAEALRDTSETLNRTLDFGEVLDHILTTVGRVVPHDTACVRLLESGRARVVRSKGFIELGIDIENAGGELQLSGVNNLQKMTATGRPVIVADTQADPSWVTILGTELLRSNIGAPIIIENEVVGFLFLDSFTPGFYTSAHAERLQAFAIQASLALHKARLFHQAQEELTERKHGEEKIKRQLERLTALREIDQIITSTFDLRLSLDALTAHTASLLAVDAVTVLLVNSATNMLEYGAGLGFWTDTIKTTSVKLGESYAGRAAAARNIVNINLVDEPHSLLLAGLLKDENFVSYYGAPLIAKGKVIGVLEVYNRSIVERDEDWFDFFNTLAGQAAIAIDNARLFEDLQRTNIELEMRVVERTADLIRANRAKDEFLATMSHELRTPLNAVLGMSESLQEGTYGELTPRQVEILRIIAESGRHLLELINDILDLSKIEAGKLELQAEPVAVEAYCRACIRMIKETAFLKNLQVSMSNTSNIEVIHADGRRLKQMLVNLLSNAIKFTPAGGQVGLEVSKEGDDAIRFSVWDTGIGIPADQLEKLFQPFVQLDSSLSRQYSGTGLGLALVRDLAELHGGRVGVESEAGRGSRFHFIIPTQSLNMPLVESVKLSAGLKRKETITSPNGEKRRILLAEDNVTNMLVTSDYLNDKGYQIIEARNGFEAVEQALGQKPDLILMDIQMPGMSGLEAIKRIRAAPGFDSVPIIALTALAMPGDRELCLEAGANEYLTKPASLKALIQMIENLL